MDLYKHYALRPTTPTPDSRRSRCGGRRCGRCGRGSSRPCPGSTPLLPSSNSSRSPSDRRFASVQTPSRKNGCSAVVRIVRPAIRSSHNNPSRTNTSSTALYSDADSWANSSRLRTRSPTTNSSIRFDPDTVRISALTTVKIINYCRLIDGQTIFIMEVIQMR